MSDDIRGAGRWQALACFEPPFRYQSGYVFDANNRMVADMPGSAVCRVRGWGRLQYRTECDPEALQDMVGILIAEALTRLWETEARREQPTPATSWHPVRCECEGCGGPKGSKA